MKTSEVPDLETALKLSKMNATSQHRMHVGKYYIRRLNILLQIITEA